jgi:nitrite reductase/ring-hydroxylating ferredoxin subunit
MAEDTEKFVRVAALADIPPGTLLGVEADGVSVCLANAGGQIYAFKNNCSHRDFPLDTGALEGTKVECSWHGAKFDVTTGKAVQLPAIKPIVTYDVRVEDNEVFVAVE